MKNLVVLDNEIKYKTVGKEDYISLTDIAKFKNSEPNIVVANWMRNRMTVEFLGL